MLKTKPLQIGKQSIGGSVYWPVKIHLYDSPYNCYLFIDGEVSLERNEETVPVGSATSIEEADKLVQEHYQKAVNKWLSVYLLTETV